MSKQKTDSGLIEWSQRQAHFHIGLLQHRQNSNGGEWRTIGIVTGEYNDASQWAYQWLKTNTEAKKAYQNRIGLE